ncbi:hypothetical protein IJ096_03270 [Candidatus Saccharibacteria bacterium]|nr:hypothetical protein [Candidatus Saccharibacteria bacterium]
MKRFFVTVGALVLATVTVFSSVATVYADELGDEIDVADELNDGLDPDEASTSSSDESKSSAGADKYEDLLDSTGLTEDELEELIDALGSVDDLEGLIKALESTDDIEQLISTLGSLSELEELTEILGSLDELEQLAEVLDSLDGLAELAEVLESLDELEQLISALESLDELDQLITVLSSMEDLSNELSSDDTGALLALLSLLSDDDDDDWDWDFDDDYDWDDDDSLLDGLFPTKSEMKEHAMNYFRKSGIRKAAKQYHGKVTRKVLYNNEVCIVAKIIATNRRHNKKIYYQLYDGESSRLLRHNPTKILKRLYKDIVKVLVKNKKVDVNNYSEKRLQQIAKKYQEVNVKEVKDFLKKNKT